MDMGTIIPLVMQMQGKNNLNSAMLKNFIEPEKLKSTENYIHTQNINPNQDTSQNNEQNNNSALMNMLPLLMQGLNGGGNTAGGMQNIMPLLMSQLTNKNNGLGVGADIGNLINMLTNMQKNSTPPSSQGTKIKTQTNFIGKKIDDYTRLE